MSRSIQWRVGLVVFFLAFSVLFVIPTLVGSLPQWWTKVFPSEKIHLGLDLQGGMYLLLEVEVRKAVDSAMDRYTSDIKETLTHKDIPFTQVGRTPDGRIMVVLPDSQANDRISQVRSDQYVFLNVASFRETDGKFQYVLEMNPKEAKSIEDSAARQALETIRNRIDQFGVTEPMIAIQGENQILVQLPGIKDPQRAAQNAAAEIRQGADLLKKEAEQAAGEGKQALLASAELSGFSTD
jgi:preprotein translocase subunit SecD